MKDSRESYTERILKAEQAIPANVSILVWGPGEHARPRWHQKRLAVVAALKQANTKFEVATSEDIFAALKGITEPSPLEYGQRELLHAKEADLIFALVLGPPEDEPGVYRELEMIARYYRIREKTYIFLPDEKSFIRRFAVGTLNNFRESHRLSYDWPQLKECSSIRKFCIDKANEELRQKMLNYLHATME